MDSSKRERRSRNISNKIQYLNYSFDSDKEAYFTQIMQNLQTQLYGLHQGTSPEYLSRLSDLEEARDYRLTELCLWEKYQLERARKQFEEETEAAVASYDKTMNMVKSKLKTRLEAQRKRLSEDRTLLNINNDHKFFQTAMNPLIPTNPTTAIAALSGAERRTLRRRDINLGSDLSGLSGNESSRKRNYSDDSGQSGTNADNDLDLLKELDNPRGKGTLRNYNGVKSLRNEDGVQDLLQIAEKVRRIG